MKHFQIIETPYVGPVDLNTLHKTYENLENMHKETVKVTSELKTAIANLELNEAEDEFKNNLVSSIERTIDENSRYGNQAAAYDDIIKLQGDIASSPALIGRLKAQQAFKAYSDKIDSLDMPDDYKEYFKEMNPYHYKDTVDENGNVIGGSKWEPIKSPTKVINLSDIVDKGIRRAAEEKGAYQITRWLDKNGKPTTNPNEAFDGEVYDVTTGQYERLGHDKIMRSIMSFIEETPGAKESLDQDYDVALWKHNKNTSSDELTVSDITDKDGVILTRDQYLRKRIEPAAQEAAYNNVVTKTNYGEGLSTYKAAQIKSKENEILLNLHRQELGASGRGTPISVEVNVGAESLERKNGIYKIISDSIKAINPNITINNDYQSLVDAVNSIPVTDENRSQINLYNEYLRLYKSAEENLNNIMEPLTPDEQKEYQFGLRMSAGGELVGGASKYDNRAISAINGLYGKGNQISIDFDNETLVNNFVSKLTDNQYSLESLGITKKGNSIYIPKESRNVLPLICKLAEDVKDDANRGFWNTIGGYFNDRYKVTTYDENNNPYIPGPSSTIHNDLTKDRVDNLSDIYKKSEKVINKYSDKYDINPTTMEISVNLLPGQSFNHTYLYDLFDKGIIDGPTYEKEIKYWNESINKTILNTDFSQHPMYYSEGGELATLVKESKDRFIYGHEIAQALSEDRVVVAPANASGVYDPLSQSLGGYYFKIFDSKNSKEKGDESTAKAYYIPGIGQEVGRDILMSDPQILINDATTKLIETRSTNYLTTAQLNNIIGDVKLQGLGYNTAQLTFKGTDIVIDKNSANAITKAIMDFDSIKDLISNKPENISTVDYLIKTGASKRLDQSAEIIASVTGFDVELINALLGRQLMQ